MKRIAKDITHYFSLFGLLIIGTIGFIIFSYDQAFQLAIIIATTMAYVAWGIVHHWIHRDLYLSIIIEYVAVGMLGLIIVYSLILNV